MMRFYCRDIVERTGAVPCVRQVTPWKNNAQGNVQHERKSNMKILTGLVVALLVCALAGIGVIGCNTMRGAGKDIQRGGRAIEKAANDTQNERARPHTISAWAEPGGWITPSGSIPVSYRSGRTFIVRAFPGYHVADVLVDGKSVGAVSRHAFDNVTANHSISALFTVNPS